MTRVMSGLLIVACLGLAACGVDGAPERPDRAAQAVGVSVSGTVSVGITGHD
ncbi:hypothetical protein [Hasllibacter sp. MH4015]|uniref:hypothetical protein n=1 Tax=Hasllibacter sp. MH4015 TaxID=2854029 RepID=UPI001CD577E5|nr:hypothetical protein [Hasllibacter sp. MH4015]